MKTIPIHEAKTNLSKLIKQAAQGKTIYVGAYGQPQAIITAIPKRNAIKIGVYAHKYIADAYQDDALIEPDPTVNDMFEDSLKRPFPDE